jgi:hypothetical protein
MKGTAYEKIKGYIQLLKGELGFNLGLNCEPK